MKIISGGQTGADQGGLEAAAELGLDYGGAVPRGRRTERGPLSPRFARMTELASGDYRERTIRNVLDADATVVFCSGAIRGGTALTIQAARAAGKAHLPVNLAKLDREQAVREIRNWLERARPAVLNVAGPRESKSPGIRRRVREILIEALQPERSRRRTSRILPAARPSP